MATKVENTDTLYIRNIPEDVKRTFKMFCVTHGVSMTSMSIEMLQRPDFYITRSMIAAAKNRDEEERSR